MRPGSECHWEFRSAHDVSRFWDMYRNVPGRAQGRKTYHEERFNLGLYLLALADHGLLTYPLSLDQDESPDFMVTPPSGEVRGLEVTRATEPWVQRKMTENAREFANREAEGAVTGGQAEPVTTQLSFQGWAGYSAETQWCSLFRAAIEKKLALMPKFRPAYRYDLLVYDETPLPAVDRGNVLASMHPYVRDLQEKNPKLGTTSFVVSLDVLYDIGGTTQNFRYVEPPNLDDAGSMAKFSTRSEYAARNLAERAVHKHVQNGIPIYSLDKNGRVVKQTQDGRRFQVTFAEDGKEVIVKELSPSG
jgi:hypothetical protein